MQWLVRAGRRRGWQVCMMICQNSLTICICIRLKYGASAASVFFQITTSGISVRIVEITHLHVKANYALEQSWSYNFPSYLSILWSTPLSYHTAGISDFRVNTNMLYSWIPYKYQNVLMQYFDILLGSTVLWEISTSYDLPTVNMYRTMSL